ncbi:hypothetical protein ARMSODRAFT_1026032 [Armillaria solidipes]|uniref:Uncharacterized protein n=1 Tax=Armillaria solidipes TaxID=1076256 RepID=A0A2H3BAT4_9AGAR|nr:hypothetical protein ARMSODRAFT_1026032 [Armillaria solidipes]
MKTQLKNVIHEFEEKHRRNVGKGDFTGLFRRAYKQAFDPETIKAAFCMTGVHPFNGNVISDQQMKPSESTSIKGAFPLLQPSPVHAVIAAFHHYKPTTFDLDPDNHIEIQDSSRISNEDWLSSPISRDGLPAPASFPTFGSPSHGLSVLSNSPSLDNAGSRTQPSTPLQRVRDLNIDPSLYTPSKHMRMMTSALSLTSSGSFLIQPTVKVTSLHSIPSPVLEGPPTLRQPDWR